MATDLSFEGVCRFIKNDFSEQVNDIDTLIDVLMFASLLLTGNPIAVAASAIHSFADIFASKAELTKLTKNIIGKITGKQDKDPIKRLERMEYAFCLICYTAFFEALENEKLLTQLLKEIKLKPEEKLQLSKASYKRLESSSSGHARSTEIESDSSAKGLLDITPALPHPEDSFDKQMTQLLPLYQELADGFFSFVTSLSVWDKTDEREKAIIKQSIISLPQKSLKYFKGQYFLLATNYPEFYIWSNLQQHDQTRSILNEMSPYVQQYVALETASQKAIDFGFLRLAQTIEAIPERIEAGNANIALKELAAFYASNIEKPIIDDPSSEGNDKVTLSYPKRSEIFIPQAFKVIRRIGRNALPLESENTWSQVPIRNDLGAFLLSYLSSPYSTLCPLIILGHPGSGKSLLTSILASRLIASPYTPIKVELRSVNADDELPKQIEDQIYKNTYRKINWALLSDHFNDHPALILLDGYDEVLQASGKVFTGYLRKVELFQQNEISIGHRPVRTILTSRITLIDQAFVPLGATIIRLLEFDEGKQKKWISVWNSANSQYFHQTRTEPFELPQKNEKIASLAEQPLLLLMLALYDSENNQLRKQKGLDQTVLYNDLLRRFIRRERMKEELYVTLPHKEQHEAIDQDMERLGVAAIGMFNRRSLYIKKPQLNADLNFFGLERKINGTGLTQSQANLLLGSFFFVQESKSVNFYEGSETRDSDTAFEFLHNTFGEFLTADFILRKVLALTYKIYKYRQDEEWKAELEEKLSNPDGLPKDWLVCLMYTPLFSRPIILAMLREWVKHNLRERKFSETDFLESMDIIVTNELKRLLDKNSIPSIISDSGKNSFGDLPVLGYLAVYSLNLILLRTVLFSNEYVFDEEKISPSLDGTRVWERLTYLWRSWFSLESLDGLTAILMAKRDGSKIHLKAKDVFSISSVRNRLDIVLNVSFALADDITSSIAGLLSLNYFDKNGINLSDVASSLRNEKINQNIKLHTINLRHGKWKETNFSLESDYLPYLQQYIYRIRHDIYNEMNFEDILLFFREVLYAYRTKKIRGTAAIREIMRMYSEIIESFPMINNQVAVQELTMDVFFTLLNDSLKASLKTEEIIVNETLLEAINESIVQLNFDFADVSPNDLMRFFERFRRGIKIKYTH